ncbi:uncharacterized protein LOC144767311 [Lissotriton helveticus]
MAYYAEEEDKWVEYNEYEEYEEPYAHHLEKHPVEAQDSHVQVQPKKIKKTKHLFYDAQEDVTPKNLLFNPQNVIHPRSTEWVPCVEVAHYVQTNLRQSFESQVRATLRSECPRPSLLGKVADTPELDPNMATFMRKFSKDPKKGLDRAWKGCKNKLLDVSGPLTKILDTAVTAKDKGVPHDSSEIMEWAQRALCFLGNANMALSTERRRSFLMRIDPQLAEMATTEPGSLANGMLFGDDFVKKMGKYVATFSALVKAQANIKRVFHSGVFNRAGRYRGRGFGRGGNQTSRGAEQRGRGGSHRSKFYPTRNRGDRGRGQCGGYRGQQFQSGDSSYAGTFFTLQGSYGGRSYCTVPSQVGGPVSRPMDSSDSSGFSSRVLFDPHAIGDSQTPTFFPCRDEFHRRGSSVVTEQRGYCADGSTSARFCEYNLLGAQERSWVSSGSELEGVQCGSSIPSFQNGGYSSLEGHVVEPELDGSIGSKRCLSDGRHFSASPALPPIPMAQSEVRVFGYALRSLVRSMVFHETYETGCSMITGERSQTHNLSGRYSDHGSVGRGGATPAVLDYPTPPGVGISPQCSQNSSSSYASDQIFRFSSKFLYISAAFASQEENSDQERVEEIVASQTISLRTLARLVGLLAASIQAIFPGPLHYRALQRLKILHLRRGLHYAEQIAISREARLEMNWWLEHMDAWNGKAIFAATLDAITESDAGRWGWGAGCGTLETGGRWSQEELRLHINCLELLAG